MFVLVGRYEMVERDHSHQGSTPLAVSEQEAALVKLKESGKYAASYYGFSIYEVMDVGMTEGIEIIRRGPKKGSFLYVTCQGCRSELKVWKNATCIVGKQRGEPARTFTCPVCGEPTLMGIDCYGS